MLAAKIIACGHSFAVLSQQEKTNSPVVLRRRVNIALSVQ
jgi:hypothetical protein